ncbi:DNA/RNA helicase domain-containing protein [Corynebacterium glutamicum]|uniref:DNA/RNA helicase domain-containing protein n=1 Tax=Corynebacterium glutamicum TaxID=1718 RepID=UPI003C7CC20B
MKQHLDGKKEHDLKAVRVVLDDTFNKSVCLDLESFLISLAFGDGRNEVLNRNMGISDADYFGRDTYRDTFQEIFEELRNEGLFQRSIPEIVNSELFKLSPFKALNNDQAIAVMDILEGLSEDLASDAEPGQFTFVQGSPGTGKTVVAVYLMKLLKDISDFRDGEDIDGDEMFSEFFLEGTRERFKDLKIGIIVPQQALRKSLERVFATTPGLSKTMVLSAFTAADSPEQFDVLIVDEAHRLNQYSAQSVPALTKRFNETNKALFDGQKPHASQLDWLKKKSRHVIMMLDLEQSVRPNDLPQEEFQEILDQTPQSRKYRLHTQMRSLGGEDYIDYVKKVFSKLPPTEKLMFKDYDLEIIDSPSKFVETIKKHDREVGLSRVVAGYAWKWVSKNDKSAYDINLGDGVQLQWNSKAVDWVNSKNAVNEAGSIHTIQGYDLNYAGVIIGRDLQYTPERGLFVDKSQYFDAKGKTNNKMRGQTTTDKDLFKYITNIYTVLLTRGMKGTYLYIVDDGLREYLGRYFSAR